MRATAFPIPSSPKICRPSTSISAFCRSTDGMSVVARGIREISRWRKPRTGSFIPFPWLIGHHFGMFDFNTIDPAEARAWLETRRLPSARVAEIGLAYEIMAQ